MAVQFLFVHVYVSLPVFSDAPNAKIDEFWSFNGFLPARIQLLQGLWHMAGAGSQKSTLVNTELA